jgi:hypothetical protein
MPKVKLKTDTCSSSTTASCSSKEGGVGREFPGLVQAKLPSVGGQRRAGLGRGVELPRGLGDEEIARERHLGEDLDLPHCIVPYRPRLHVPCAQRAEPSGLRDGSHETGVVAPPAIPACTSR